VSGSDEAAITALLHEYADAALAVDGARWSSLWTEECLWVLGPDRVLRGRNAVLEAWRASISKYSTVVQLYLSSYAIVDGDAATGRAYLQEVSETMEGARLIMAGYYDDAYSRTPDGWRFTQRKLTKLYFGPPDLSGPLGQLS
jgi:uncharacterized protein (TIGR02246 family)